MKIFESIPSQQPASQYLDSINSPEDLRKLNKTEIPIIADELREFLLYTVGKISKISSVLSITLLLKNFSKFLV